MKEVAIPRTLVGYMVAATAIATTEQVQQLRNRMKVMTIELNSVSTLRAKQATIATKNQPPETYNYFNKLH